MYDFSLCVSKNTERVSEYAVFYATLSIFQPYQRVTPKVDSHTVPLRRALGYPTALTSEGNGFTKDNMFAPSNYNFSKLACGSSGENGNQCMVAYVHPNTHIV